MNHATSWTLALVLMLAGCATSHPQSQPHLKPASLAEVLTLPKFDSKFETPDDAWLLSKVSDYLENNTLTAEMTGSLLLQVQAIETVPLGRMEAPEFFEVNLALRLFDVTRDLIIEKGIILRRQALQRELAAINDEASRQYELHRKRLLQTPTGASPPVFDPSFEQRWQESYARLQADPKPILAETGNAFILLCRERGLTLLQGLSNRDLVADFLSRQPIG